ncbi:MAG TPA: heterodisulfide reductase-related iron-sulfur binding cluster [Pyrinomonadaceae bacterium]|nr:heterodisulfide reductase-related iron-sulfur binding cluster [Pyrinomonadaceae bacterium]
MASQLTTMLAIEEQKLLACVHCGLCLEACPTYVATGDENDSPRGRIYLMRAVEEGRLAPDAPSFERHIDRCLGCRACESVCPAGVEYGQLLEAGRSELLDSKIGRGPSYALLRLALRHIWLQPRRLRFAFTCGRLFRNTGLPRLLVKSKLARLISRRFEFGLALLASSTAGISSRSRANVFDVEHHDRSKSGRDARGPSERDAHELTRNKKHAVSVFTGCVTEGLFNRVTQATLRVLNFNGCEVDVPAEQVCCGALHAHAGDLDGARRLARQNIAVFKNDSAASIITNAGGCGAMLASYGHLFAHDEQLADAACGFSNRVRDVSQQLAATGIKSGAEIGSGTVTYDASCHLIYGQHAGDAPLEMLRAIPGLRFVPLAGSERCCGGAGVYNLMEPELSGQVLAEKLGHIRESGASLLATGNPGCHMQIRAGAMLAGWPLRVCHPVELLDESYQRLGSVDSNQ